MKLRARRRIRHLIAMLAWPFRRVAEPVDGVDQYGDQGGLPLEAIIRGQACRSRSANSAARGDTPSRAAALSGGCQ